MKMKKVDARTSGKLAAGISRKVPARVSSKVRGKGKKMVRVAKELRGGENCLIPATVADILRRVNSGGEPLFPNIHEASVYSKPPKELVEEFPERAVWLNGHGDEVRVWVFRGEKGRGRVVGGSGRKENGKWYGEGGPKEILDAEGELIPWASRKRFSYRINGTTGNQRGESTGWVMAEFSLTNKEEGTVLICVLYQSNRNCPETPRADSSSPGEKTPPLIEQGHNEAEEEDGATADASLGFPGAGSDMPSSQSIGIASISNLLVLAAEKATISCAHYKKACEIKEFVLAEKEYLRTINELKLDESIISEPRDKLKILLQGAAITEELTSKARDKIVSCCEHLSTIIHSALSDERMKRERQENNALRRIGINVHSQVPKRASQVTDVPLVVRDSAGSERVHYQAPAEHGVLSRVEGAENERPIPVNTSAASSSGVKRKADQDLLEAPPSTRLERADTDIDGQEENNQMSFSETNPMPAGADCVMDLACGVTIGVPQVQPEQQGPVEVAEGGSGACNGLCEIDEIFYSEVPIPAGVDNGRELACQVTIGVPQFQPEQQVLAEVAEGGSGACNDLYEIDGMLAGGDNGGELAYRLKMGVPQVQPEQQRLAEVAEGSSGACNGLYDIDGFFYSEVPMPARGDNSGVLACGVTIGVPQVQPEQQGFTEVAEGGNGPGNALAGGDSSGDSYWAWCSAVILQGNDNINNTGGLPVVVDSRIGEPAMPEYAPGAVTEGDAAQGSSTGPECPEENEHQLSTYDDLTAVGVPGELMEDFPGQFEADKYQQRPIDLAVGWYWVSASEAEPEDGITFDELTGGRSADELLGPSHGDMSGASTGR